MGGGEVRAELGGTTEQEEAGDDMAGPPLTFILRTPASPWIPAEMGQRHPRRGGQGTIAGRWSGGDMGRGQILTQAQLHLIVGQLEGGLGAGNAAGGQAEPQRT